MTAKPKTALLKGQLLSESLFWHIRHVVTTLITRKPITWWGWAKRVVTERHSATLVVHMTLTESCQTKRTRSSPQWWSGRSTTPHDVLNLWSPIYDPSVWGTWGSGWAHSVVRPCIPISSLLIHMAYLLPSLPLEEATASRATFVIVSGSDGRADERKCFWSQTIITQKR